MNRRPIKDVVPLAYPLWVVDVTSECPRASLAVAIVPADHLNDDEWLFVPDGPRRGWLVEHGRVLPMDLHVEAFLDQRAAWDEAWRRGTRRELDRLRDRWETRRMDER
ncbi:MAG: hypothetical protein ACOYBP_09230 [Microbacteriaceae bacterium]